MIFISSASYGQTVADQSTLVHPQKKHAPIRKAGKYLLKLYLGISAKVDDPQGLATVKLRSRDDPDVPKDDDEITVYGVNRGNNSIIYNNSLLSVAIYGKNLPEEQRLNSPYGITANPEGRVLVADTGNDRIVELQDSGTLSHKRTYGKKGNGRGEFNAPLDVKFDSQGNFYVLDSGNNRIQFFSADGEVLKIWGEGDGLSLNNPISMAVTDIQEKWSYRKKNMIIVSDNSGASLKKLTGNGVLTKEVTGADIGYPDALFSAIALDYYDNIYATDKKNHLIHKFNSNLSYITSFGKKGKSKNEFIEPRGIAIWRRLGQVIIGEKETVQYYLIGTDLQDVKLETVKGGVYLSAKLTERSILKVDIFDEDNNFVRRLNKTGKKYGPGNITFRWNMMPGEFEKIYKEVDGYVRKKNYSMDEKVPAGKYEIRLEAKPTYSSKKYFADREQIDLELKENGIVVEIKQGE
ncbi:MAG: hypothetical protein IIA58_01315 [Candidatus Marinimicrobia bacterium]|nr:hypothetical protein [Candidatus Neomarinimicrobiota bacterium]